MTMVLGPTSLSLAAPFSSDLITYANFTVTRMPNSGVEDVGKVAKIKPSKEFVWREKMAFSYRVRREKLTGKHTSLVRTRALGPGGPGVSRAHVEHAAGMLCHAFTAWRNFVWLWHPASADVRRVARKN